MKAMLGVTGFETSSNFVEEQAPGVFPRTLRNMWTCVSIYNPLLVLLALFCFDTEYMSTHQPSLMADMGQKVRQPFCKYILRHAIIHKPSLFYALI